jgi:hypothetical protein
VPDRLDGFRHQLQRPKQHDGLASAVGGEIHLVENALRRPLDSRQRRSYLWSRSISASGPGQCGEA